MLDKNLLKPEQKVALNTLETIENNLLRNDFIESLMIINDIPSIATMKKEIINEYKTKLLYYFDQEKNNFILDCISDIVHEKEQKNDIPIQQPNTKKCIKDYLEEIKKYQTVSIIDSDMFVNAKLGSEFEKTVIWSGSTKKFFERYVGIFANLTVVEKTNRIRLLSADNGNTISLLVLCSNEQKGQLINAINELRRRVQV